MRFGSVALGSGLLGATAVTAAKAGMPVDKIYGVNLGSWLLAEPWMFPNEWVNKMGGESCDDCSKCAASEFDLVKKLGQTRADKVFAQHWSTWFTQKEVDAIAAAGLNTVRIPLGYWIIEDLVNRKTEYYPKGGLKYLKNGLRMLKAKGIHAILDFHAMPGVAAVQQMFAGRCTNDVQFYKEENYERALTWAAIMTNMTYQDPDFSTVFAIEAVNEPVMDASKTPGYGDYQKRFVKVVRSVEKQLGVLCQGVDPTKISSPSSDDADDIVVNRVLDKSSTIMKKISGKPSINPPSPSTDGGFPITLGDEVEALHHGHGAGRQPLPMSGKLTFPKRSEEDGHGLGLEGYGARRRHHKRGISAHLAERADNRTCLMTTFMNKDWQYNNPPNPADAANGPQLYDAHLYFSFGGVADPNPDSYMRTICNTDRVQKAYSDNNNPLVFGEWSLATNFDATEGFLHDWADAQRHIYAGQADGWIYWSLKIEGTSPYLRQWSYLQGLKNGYFKNDPAQLTNPNVCQRWITSSNGTTSP
ncbi:unnamed protein product [Rhizoctonia solani]|uniref:Glycoside hydrolase family 5 domain-containing protein n=1 Tax=Rhizoctonia solani TaxID=456999 RepID=A0A8H3CQL2_9AGAM|nr:unnamed protein product [Rhizoctonia solani]